TLQTLSNQYGPSVWPSLRAEQAEKELVLASVAYNLVVRVRRQAATQAGVEARRPSFTGTLGLVRAVWAKVGAGGLSAAELEGEFAGLIGAVGQRQVPQRPGRQFKRELLPRQRRYPSANAPRWSAILSAVVMTLSGCLDVAQPSRLCFQARRLCYERLF